jgi:outer membrane protein TolC
MKYFHYSNIVFLTAALLPLSGFAQDEKSSQTLTIEAAVTEGLDRSPEIQRARAIKSENEWRHFETLGSGFLPKVSVEAHHYFDTKYTLTSINFGGDILSFPGFYPTNSASLDVMIPIFDGMANVRNLQSATLVNDASTEELTNAEFHLKEEIRLAFYKALAADQLQTVAAQNVKTLEDHLKQVDTQKKGGVATNYDVLRVQVQLNEAHADAIDAEDAFETSRRKLTELIGLEADQRTLKGNLPVPNVDRVKDLKMGEVTKQRPDIKALDLRAEASERTQRAQSDWLIPSVYVGGEYMLYDSQVFSGSVQDTGNYLSAYNVGVFLKWNLFDGGVAIAREKEAAFRTVESEKTAEVAKLQVPYDFEYWKRRYISNTDHYISKKFDISRSEESVRLAKEEERAGTRTSTETLDAELDLFRAKAGVVNAIVNAAEAEIRLELALGREI